MPPPSKVNHSTSWAGATVCQWQLVQLDPLVAKNAMESHNTIFFLHLNENRDC